MIQHFIPEFQALHMLLLERSSFKTKDKKHSIHHAMIYMILPHQWNVPYFVL